MIEEYDHVRIKSSGITGILVDMQTKDGKTSCIVESDEKGVPGGYGPEDSWKLFDCTLDDLEKLPD